jgi:hypothetical protein
MTTPIGPGGASLLAAADELIGPLSGAVQPQPLPWAAGSTFDTGEPTYQPLLLLRLGRDLTNETLSVTVTVGGSADWSLSC